ncbi:MAG: LysM peptidoglycan-binding domain-containing protein, partial [Opitutaceae bacterium]|nr:LysM peptidoglycan-binding domain-containing protein [Opitutaceae bacterium]
ALTTQLAAPKPAAPGYPDLSGRVKELESQLAAANGNAAQARKEIESLTQAKAEAERLAAAKPAAPAYPDLSGRVKELEAQVAAAASAKPAYPDLSGRVQQLEGELAAAHRQAESAVQTAVAASKQSAADLHSANEQIANLKAALAAVQPAPTYPDLSGRVKELETAQAGLQRQLAEATAAQAKASDGAQGRQLSERVAALTSENTQLRGDRERMQKMIADAGKQLREATAGAARARELETQLAAQQGQAEALAAAQEQVANLKATLASAQPAAPAYPDLSGRVRELEGQVASLQAAAQPAAPAYPDLTGRVRDLEAQLAAATTEAGRARDEAAALARARDDLARNRTPAYPNLAGRVVELETALADTRRQLTDTETALRSAQAVQAPAPAAAAEPAAPAPEVTDLEKRLAETEDRLRTALRGYALLQKDRDALKETSERSAGSLATERDTLAAQVATLTAQVEELKAGAATQSESLGALQRSTSQTAIDLAAARALARELQGANSVLATENYRLKTQLAGGAGTPRPAAVPAPVPAARMHTVAAGDSLARLSQQYYGTPDRWQEIYQANSAKLGPNGTLRVGTELRIP